MILQDFMEKRVDFCTVGEVFTSNTSGAKSKHLLASATLFTPMWERF